MLIHKYLERVVGSKIKVKIVRAMLRFPGKSFTVRELASFIKVSHTPVLRSLGDLEGMNLIKIEKHGTASLLRINKESCLYKPLKDLFLFEEKTKENLIEALRLALSKVKMAVLFGSIQKGEERMDSDIDLLIVTDNKKKARKELEKQRIKIINKFGNVISPIILTEEEFKKKKNKPFAKDILKDYCLIKGEDLIVKYWKR